KDSSRRQYRRTAAVGAGAAGDLAGVDQPMPAPADAEEPCSWRRDARLLLAQLALAAKDPRAPSVESSPGARLVQRHPQPVKLLCFRQMLPRVEQYIGEPVPNLARCG